jgi:hypothetical protein
MARIADNNIDSPIADADFLLNMGRLGLLTEMGARFARTDIAIAYARCGMAKRGDCPEFAILAPPSQNCVASKLQLSFTNP